MIRAPVNPKLMRWARERAGMAQESLTPGFKKLPEWEDGRSQPTFRQAEAFARAVHVPVGYLFCSTPPKETVPIPDLRNFGEQAPNRPSANLLDTIYICQERQSWYQSFVRGAGERDLAFVGSAETTMSAEATAKQIRDKLGFDLAARQACSSATDALQLLISQADDAGILVMVSGVVMSNDRRRLDPDEFSGFALCDPFAPLIFVNGTTTKAAQMFTLAHEIVQVWLGASALSNLGIAPQASCHRQELWCNLVAAELLVPLETLRSDLCRNEQLSDALSRLSRRFKVGRLVILRRLFDADWLTCEQFGAAWIQESEHQRSQVRSSGVDDVYRSTVARNGRRFTHALVASTLEGQTLYRDAFRMLGVTKTESFDRLGRGAGVIT